MIWLILTDPGTVTSALAEGSAERAAAQPVRGHRIRNRAVAAMVMRRRVTARIMRMAALGRASGLAPCAAAPRGRDGVLDAALEGIRRAQPKGPVS
ncbi:MAG: hypothetical protein MZV64_43215 [Ignavibacteriales bacterium]|nr:hypothetical protein [Ignavibacteriales bacterium]